MRPTRSGVVAALAVIVVFAAGRLLGLTELFVVGTALAAAVLWAPIWVLVRSPRIDTDRAARPRRVPAGGTCHVAITLTNRGSRTTVLHLTDRVEGLGEARLRIAPIPRGQRREALYDLPTTHRGVVRIGPMTLAVEDPFVLMRRTVRIDRWSSVVVLPRVVPLDPLPAAPGESGDRSTSSFRSMSTVDEEFVALREYVPGDDVRRIHWPSTARRRSPVVRQYDRPWQRRTTVVLDCRHTRHPTGNDPDGAEPATTGPGAGDGPAFERAVSAAASVIVSGIDAGEAVRLVTTNGLDTGFVAGRAAHDDLLDRLAEVQRHGVGALDGTFRLLGRRDLGRVVTCSARTGAEDLAAIARVPAGLHVLVVSTPVAATPAHVITVEHTGAQPLDAVWRRAVMTRVPT